MRYLFLLILLIPIAGYAHDSCPGCDPNSLPPGAATMWDLEQLEKKLEKECRQTQMKIITGSLWAPTAEPTVSNEPRDDTARSEAILDVMTTVHTEMWGSILELRDVHWSLYRNFEAFKSFYIGGMAFFFLIGMVFYGLYLDRK